MSEHGQQGAANGRQDSWGFLKDAQGFRRLDAGSRAGFTSSRPPPHHEPRYFIFSYFCTTCGVEALRNLDLLIKTGWSVIFPFFAENAVVGRRQHSESIEVTLDMQ